MNSTLKNGFRLLEILALAGTELTVKSLSEQTGLPSSHVCRLLKTLLATGYVEQNPTSRRYRISLKILTLSHTCLSRLDLRRIGHPFLVELGEQLNAQSYLSAPWRGYSIVVDIFWPRHGKGNDPAAEIGQTHSVRHSACGKVCAAYASPEERCQLQMDGRVGDSRKGEDWGAEFDRIRNRGLAIRNEQGILALAAPLFRAGDHFCGAIGAMLPTGTLLTDTIEETLRSTARGLSFALGQPFSQ